MNDIALTFRDTELIARASGALWWPARSTLIISDLHLGKSERIARRSGMMLPPYEALDTLERLQAEIAEIAPRRVICLGDSFDDNAAAMALPDNIRDWITRLVAGRTWIWVEGNHDPEPMGFAGAHSSQVTDGPLIFRHIATPGAVGEVSGHYHPKARLVGRGRQISRPCFLCDDARIILPAFGTYTGGLSCDAPVLCDLMGRNARAILTGSVARAIPMPRRNAAADQKPAQAR